MLHNPLVSLNLFPQRYGIIPESNFPSYIIWYFIFILNDYTIVIQPIGLYPIPCAYILVMIYQYQIIARYQYVSRLLLRFGDNCLKKVKKRETLIFSVCRNTGFLSPSGVIFTEHKYLVAPSQDLSLERGKIPETGVKT